MLERLLGAKEYERYRCVAVSSTGVLLGANEWYRFTASPLRGTWYVCVCTYASPTVIF